MAGEQVAGISGFGFNPWMMNNMYSNQLAMNDLYDDTFGCAGMMTNPIMSMDGSIFGGGACMPYMPYMPYTPGFTGENQEDWMRRMEAWQDYSIDRQVKYQERSRNADLRLNAPIEGIQDAGAILNEKIHKDEQEQILPALAEYIAQVKAAYPQASDEDVLKRAKSLYKQQFQKDLIDDIRSNGKDAFTQGFIQAVTFGLADNKTAEENIADITGQQVGRADQTKKILGRAAGGAVVGGTATYLLSFMKAFKFLGKSRPLLGAIAGAAIAGISALCGGTNTSLNKG